MLAKLADTASGMRTYVSCYARDRSNLRISTKEPLPKERLFCEGAIKKLFYLLNRWI